MCRETVTIECPMPCATFIISITVEGPVLRAVSVEGPMQRAVSVEGHM